MACDEWFEAISASVDGELYGAEAAAVAGHLETCAPCQALEARLSTFRRRTILHVPDAVPDLSAAILTDSRGARLSGHLANRTLLHRGVAAAVLVGVVVAAVGAFVAGGGAAVPAAPTAATVFARGAHFTNHEVHVTPGSTVNWKNQGSDRHQLVVDVGGATMTGSLEPGQSDSVTFDQPGTYDYHCNVHDSMTGTVVVES